MISTAFLRNLVSALICLFAAVCYAQSDAPEPSARESEVSRASSAALAAAQQGPKTIPLGDEAVLNLPAGFAYIPIEQSKAFMTAMGNHTGANFLGLVVAEKLSGFVAMNYKAAGYIKDDDAKDWDADDLLKNLKEGTEAANEDRRKRHIPEFSVVGWIEPPSYDGTTHRLVWSAALQNKDAAPGAVQGVNYNTYLLGREGYLELNLVTDRSSIEAEKPFARELLSAVSFKDGKRYADFDAGHDKVAEYGLAALVGGLAIKKLGLLATLGIFLAKAWKLVALAVFGVGAGIRKFFSGKKDNESA